MDIHAWLSNQYSLSSSSAVSLPAAIRADSPLLGFPSSDLSSEDPLLYPAPNYARDQPRTDDPDRDIAIKSLIQDINSWHAFHTRDKPLPPPPIIPSEQSAPTPPSSPSTPQHLLQPSPLPASASPTRRSSRFPSIASAVALGLGYDNRKAVYIPSPDDVIDSPIDSEPELKTILAPSSSPVSTFTSLTTPALSPVTSPAMSPTATSFSGYDSYQDEKNSRSPSRRPSQVLLSPRDQGLSRRVSQTATSLSRDNSLRSSHSPFVSTQLSRKPSCSQPSQSPKPSSPSPSLYLSRKSSAQFYSTNTLSPKNSHTRLSHPYTRGATSFSATTSQVFVGSDGRPVELEKDWDVTVTQDHPTYRPSAEDLFIPPSPSISTFSRVSHSSTSASPSPQITFHSPTSSLSSPSAVFTTDTTPSPNCMTNPPPPSPPLTPTTVSQTPLQTDLCPHSELCDFVDGPNASRSRWSLTSSLLDVPSSATPPHFTFPFSSPKEGRAHVKSKSSASSPENSTPKDLSDPVKDRDGDKPKSKGKGKLGTKRARLVSFISRFGAQVTTSAPSVPTTGTDTVAVPTSPTSMTTSLPTPLTLVTDADKADIDVSGSGSSDARTPFLAVAFPTPPVGGGSPPTSPVNGEAAARWSESVPSSPTGFGGVVSGMGRGGSVPSSPSVPAFPYFDDVSTSKTSGRNRGRANTLSVGTGSRVSSGLSLAGIIGGNKRKLVVSGIGKEDLRGYDAVRAWCESFGEVRHISRKPNGDMHIDFRKSSVADTVCRVQAQVHIKGAGSVCLSWYTKK